MQANNDVTIKQSTPVTSRLFHVEIVLVVVQLCGFPLSLLMQFYVVDWYGQQMIPVSDVNCSASHFTSTHSPLTVPRNRSSMPEVDIRSQASMFGALKSVVSGAPALLSALYLGPVSDRYGRRWTVLPPLAGICVKAFVLTVVVYLRVSIWWLLVGAFIDGLCGYFTTLYAGCSAYVVDRVKSSGDQSSPDNNEDTSERQTESRKMTLRLTAVELVSMFAASLPPLGVGFVVERFNKVLVLLVVDVLMIVNLLYTFCLLPNEMNHNNNNIQTAERVHREHKSTRNSVQTPTETSVLLQRSNSNNTNNNNNTSHGTPWPPPSLHIMKESVAMLCHRDGASLKLRLLLLCFLLCNLPAMDHGVTLLYVLSEPLHWSATTVGFYTGILYTVSTVGGLIVVRVLTRCTSAVTIALLAALTAAATNIYKPFATTTFTMFLSVVLSPISSLLIPCIRSAMSSTVDFHQQGAVFSCLAFTEVLCVMFGATIFNSIYAQTEQRVRGFVFLTMAMFHSLGAVCLLWLLTNNRRRQLQDDTTSSSESDSVGSINSR